MNTKKITDKMSGMAWEIRQKLLESGIDVWGVLVSGESDLEIYFYEEITNMDAVKAKLEGIKKPPREEVKNVETVI